MIITKPLSIKQPEAADLIRDQESAPWFDLIATSAVFRGYLFKYQPMGKYDGYSLNPCYIKYYSFLYFYS